MLKRTINYESFDGEPRSREFHFHVSKPELVELMAEQEDFNAWLQSIIETKDHKVLLEIFKRIILLSYGERSEDGENFYKSEELKNKFASTNAFNALYMELATDDAAGAEFILGILPRDLAGETSKKIKAVDTPDVSTTPAVTSGSE